VRFYAQQVTLTLNELLEQARANEATAAPLLLEGDFLNDQAAIT